MKEVFPSSEWENHPFMSRLQTRSDIDGDSAFCILDVTEDEIEFSKRVQIFSRINGGEWWEAPFNLSQAFVWFNSPAWYYTLGKPFHPYMLLDKADKANWRWEFKAEIHLQPIERS
jgi:hypothetical protein